MWFTKKTEPLPDTREPIVTKKEPGRIGQQTCSECGGVKGGNFCQDCGQTLVKYIDPATPYCPKCRESRDFEEEYRDARNPA